MPFPVDALLTTYGYWAVLVFVAIESTGIPFPGDPRVSGLSLAQ